VTHDGLPDAPPQPAADRAAPDEPRPMIERLGLGAIAVVVAVLFGALGVAALASNELFLGVMGLTGALMTMWAAIASVRRG
jgi:hypothetical protein